jgi:hypothetical protein
VIRHSLYPRLTVVGIGAIYTSIWLSNYIMGTIKDFGAIPLLFSHYLFLIPLTPHRSRIGQAKEIMIALSYFSKFLVSLFEVRPRTGLQSQCYLFEPITELITLGGNPGSILLERLKAMTTQHTM